MSMTPPDGGVRPGFQTWLWGTPGNPVIHIHERVHPNGNEEGRDIELAAVAAYRELLGYDDPLEALEAIIHIDDHGVPPADPVTGENVWHEPLLVLQAREEAREGEALRAEQEGCDAATKTDRAARAAYDAVHQPIDGGECLLDRVRRAARERLGCPEPSKKCGVETRDETPKMHQKPSRLERVFQPAMSRRAMLHEMLEGLEDGVKVDARHFLHSLSGYDRDPLAPPPPPSKRPVTLDDIRSKYQEAH